MRMSARNRLHSLLNEGSLVELGSELGQKTCSSSRLPKNIRQTGVRAKETGEKDALVVMKGRFTYAGCRRRVLNSRSWAAQ